MSVNINMSLSLDQNCSLVATYVADETDKHILKIISPCIETTSASFILDPDEYAIVEFLTDYQDENIFSTYRVHHIESAIDPEITKSNPIKLSKDGSYTFYRMIIPILEHLKSGSTYLTNNRYFAYDNGSGYKVYYLKKNISSPSEIQESDIVINYLIMWADKASQDMFYYGEKFFSLCKINNCLVKLQKKMFNKTGCDFTCKNEETNTRDFLLASIYVLRNLSEQGRYEDAQDIIDSIQECGGLCGGSDVNTLTSCGCGQA